LYTSDLEKLGKMGILWREVTMQVNSKKGFVLFKSKSFQNRVGKGITHIILISSGFFFMLPFFWMLSTSLKSDLQIFNIPPVWIPNPVIWSNFPRALMIFPFLTYLKNTLFYCILCVIGTMISSSLVAYAFSRMEWKWRNAVFILVLSTMMLPFQVTMIPLFILFRRLGWVGTFKPLIVPAFFGSPFFIFLLRQFFMTIPKELSDAAKIDGCSEFGIYARIIIPLSKPALAVVVLFEFLGRWNDFLGPLIYINDELNYTVAIGLQQFVGQHESEWALLMAASTAITIPIIILFFFTQRTFIQGIALTGLKG
jgi:multiple sugar transport system permease protein